MKLRNTLPHGSAFTMPVGVYANGADPSSNWSIAHPIALRRTVRFGQVSRAGRRGLNASMLTPASGVVGQTGQFTVNSNNFTLPAHIILGEYTLISNLDFTPGGTTALTAAAIAIVISRLPGFTATANLSVVSILFDSPQVEVPFRVWHTSSLVTNFNALSPISGYLATGVPQVGPPVITR